MIVIGGICRRCGDVPTTGTESGLCATCAASAPFGPITSALYGQQDVTAFFEQAVEGLAGDSCPWEPDEAIMVAEDARYEACQMGGGAQ